MNDSPASFEGFARRMERSRAGPVVPRRWIGAITGVCAVFLTVPAIGQDAKQGTPIGNIQVVEGPTSAAEMTMSAFLDRLMIAESGGRADAANARSTAVGPYQFIESTWLDIVRRSFATETQALTQIQILALRTDPAFSRRAAEIYTKDNAAVLKANGIEPTFPRLRLAHLLGPQGAVRVLLAPPQSPVRPLLGNGALSANPFMASLTAEALIARAARDLSVSPTMLAGVSADDTRVSGNRSPKPGLLVRCNLDRPACRHWKSLALNRSQVRRQVAMARAR